MTKKIRTQNVEKNFETTDVCIPRDIDCKSSSCRVYR